MGQLCVGRAVAGHGDDRAVGQCNWRGLDGAVNWGGEARSEGLEKTLPPALGFGPVAVPRTAMMQSVLPT